jgi:DNA (cytosine-5)-methyltransferase 3A
MSCGQQALERVGIKVDNYFASEIDKYAITITMANYPNTKQLGSVVNVDGYSLPKIDLLIGGSPCQSFSFAGKRKGMSTKDEQEILTLDHYLELKSQEYDFEGQSYLFWEYMRLLNEVKPKYFLLENVMMGEKWEKILSKAIGVNPIMINSSLLSAQNRQRLYWTNIGMKPSGLFGDLESTIQQPKDLGILLKDILEPEVDEKYFLKENSFIFDRIKNNHPFTPRIPNDNEKSNCLCIGGKGTKDLIVHNKNHEGKTGFVWQPTEGNKKGACLRANSALAATDNSIIVKIDKKGNVKNNQDKASCFTAGGNSGGNHSDMDLIIVHNTMPRSSKTGKGGTGPLKREDGKTYCLDTGQTNAIQYCNNVRRLTPIECERLQTVKDNYTNHVSDSQRYKMLGNGWTVDVIAHILKYI